MVGFEEDVAVFEVVDCNCYGASKRRGLRVVFIDGAPAAVPRSQGHEGR